MSALEIVSINPPIRGSIVKIGYDETLTVALECINPPIRGSIVVDMPILVEDICINPPIRGSIEEYGRAAESKSLVSIPL